MTASACGDNSPQDVSSSCPVSMRELCSSVFALMTQSPLFVSETYVKFSSSRSERFSFVIFDRRVLLSW